MIKKVIASFLIPALEYAAVVWSKHLKKPAGKVAKVQRGVTRWGPNQ